MSTGESSEPRPWYRLYPATFLVMLVTAVLLSPLAATVVHAFLKTYDYDENRYTGPVRLLSLGLFFFCLMAVAITATVSERWHRLRIKPKEKDLKEIIEEEKGKLAKAASDTPN
ncbi:MAG TPA: hypothetical protein VEJ63_23730 [Planctomycetota bacterium]|nr:hypothetical protein [Planctomycetota bacterium]